MSKGILWTVVLTLIMAVVIIGYFMFSELDSITGEGKIGLLGILAGGLISVLTTLVAQIIGALIREHDNDTQLRHIQGKR